MSRSPLARVAAATGLTFVTVSAGLLLAPSALAATELPAPTVSAGVPGQTFTISGTGCTSPEPNPALRVNAGVGYGEMGDGGDVKPNKDGSWTVTLTVPDQLPAGSYPVTAWCTLYQGQEIDYAKATMTVAGPAATPSAPSTATPAAPTSTPAATVTTDTKGVVTVTAAPGQSLTPAAPAKVGERRILRLTGFIPGEQVRLVLHSTPRTIGTFTADASGTVVVDFVAPAGTASGDHELKVTRADGTVVSYPIRIAAASAALATTGGDELAYTGADVTVPLIAGAGLVALGGATVLATRRRKAGAQI